MNGHCEMYLRGTMERCEEPATFHVESRNPEVKKLEQGDGEFCFSHAVQLAALFEEDGRPEYKIELLVKSDEGL